MSGDCTRCSVQFSHGGYVKLIVGLGNPGPQYLLSRHNAGFLAVDILAREENIGIKTVRFDSLFGRGSISGVPVILAKPQTFMNLSGASVEKLVRFFKIDIEDVIVIHDDLDLSQGDVRVKISGGDAGHKGLRSVIDHLASSEFVRIRVGIGKPSGKEMIEGYVLERFSEDELKLLPDITAKAFNAVIEVVSSGAHAAMNKFNVRETNNSGKEV
jgi:PTH1 family peptidyl-tRNA hydrolase